MKKFYAFMMMASFAVSSACAFTGFTTVNHELKAPQQIVDRTIDLSQFDTRHQLKDVEPKTVKSRADEAVDYSGTYIQYYTDYFDLYKKREKYLKTGIVEITPDEEEGEGYYLIKNLFATAEYLNPVKAEIVENDDETVLIIPANQFLGEIPLTDGSTFYAYTMDSKVVNNPETKEQEEVEATEFEFVYEDGSFYPMQYFFGISVYDKPIEEEDSQMQGYWTLAWYNALFAPNATLKTLENQMSQSGDIVSTEEIEYPVYYEFYQDEDSGNFMIDISTLSPIIEEPYLLELPVELNMNDLSQCTVVYDSQYVEFPGEKYGYFYLTNTETEESELTGVLALDTETIDGERYLDFNSLSIAEPYIPLSSTGYLYPIIYMESKVVANNGTDGIQSVVKDNSNVPVEFYNIQGIKINNPQPGNLYIVKRGNEVSKVIIR